MPSTKGKSNEETNKEIENENEINENESENESLSNDLSENESVNESDNEIDSSIDESEYESDYNNLKKSNNNKRKRTQSDFGEALRNLTENKDSKIEILPNANKSLKKHKLSLKAQKALRDEKKNNEDLGRVKDVVAGWAVPSEIRDEFEVKDVNRPVDAGADKEKRLRKIGQKGVVKLFNAILIAQKTEKSTNEELSNKDKGLGKARLPAPSNFPKQKSTSNDNKKQASSIAKNAFMDAIRKG